MQLTVDLTGSSSLWEELDTLARAQQAIADLMCGMELDQRGKDRLSTLL